VSKLWELEQRLRDEPDNLGLRVALAGELREAGRDDDAVELYRSVAIAYRAQGRTQQAISVCRSVLEIAADPSCEALLAAMLGERAPHAPPPLELPDEEPVDAVPVRLSSSNDITPLPAPLPHHIAEPTIPPLAPHRPLAPRPPRPAPPMPSVPDEQPIALSPADLPPSEPGDEAAQPRLEGIAAAARQISASLLAGDTSALRRPRRPAPAEGDAEPIDVDDVVEVTEAEALATEPIDLIEQTPRPRAVDDEKTTPREQPNRPRTDAGTGATADPLDSPLLAAIAKHNRVAVLQRFRRRVAAIGTTVIRRGETGHALVLVVRGRLDVHSERADGARVSLEAIEPGGFVGEQSLLARAPAPAYVVAARDSELLVLAAVDFYEVSTAFPLWRTELRAAAELRTRAHAERLR
jgi:hypothetical protein